MCPIRILAWLAIIMPEMFGGPYTLWTNSERAVVIMPLTLPSTLFRIHYAVTNLPFDNIYSSILTVLLNKPYASRSIPSDNFSNV
jgi:hypothetical protein